MAALLSKSFGGHLLEKLPGQHRANCSGIFPPSEIKKSRGKIAKSSCSSPDKSAVPFAPPRVCDCHGDKDFAVL